MSGLRQGDGLLPLLFQIILDVAIKKTKVITEVFTNQEPQILAFADYIDTVERSTVGIKEIFLKIEEVFSRSSSSSFNIFPFRMLAINPAIISL